jgi:hypothetical protein
MTLVILAVDGAVEDTQLTLQDLPTMVRLSSAIHTPTAIAVTMDGIAADLVMTVMSSPEDTTYSTAVLDTLTVDTQWRIRHTANRTLAADPSGHRISPTIV